MNRISRGRLLAAGALALAATLAGVATAEAAIVYLRADVTQKTMPDGTVVPMWGFAQDSYFGAHDGVVTVPGPQLVVPPGDSVLDIVVENELPVPVSIIVPGQRSRTTPQPVRVGDGRARSLTYETPPGNSSPVTYSFNFRYGSFIYHSATHMAVQVPMGLYGAAIRERTAGTRAYPGTATYQSQAVLFYSEIDPDLNIEVVTGDSGFSRPDPFEYNPQYFLVNGEPYSTAEGFDPNVPLGVEDQRALLRFFNASPRTHVPLLQGMYMTVIAEDGFRLADTREQVTLMLPAMKTMDVIVAPARAGTYPIYDRRLALVNGIDAPGGMLRYLKVGDSTTTVRGGGIGAPVSPRSPVRLPKLSRPTIGKTRR